MPKTRFFNDLTSPPSPTRTHERKKKPFCHRRQIEDKSSAITPELIEESRRIFGEISDKDPVKIAKDFAREHSIFAYGGTLIDLEDHSLETAVAIGYYKRGKRAGYPLVGNPIKGGENGSYGFPGGRVRPGESPKVSLQREIEEETGLLCELTDPDNSISTFKIGEEEHLFSGYEVKFTGGKIRIPAFDPEEPIDSVIIVDEKILEEICKTNGYIRVKGLPDRHILLSHRKAFLIYLALKRARAGSGAKRRPDVQS